MQAALPDFYRIALPAVHGIVSGLSGDANADPPVDKTSLRLEQLPSLSQRSRLRLPTAFPTPDVPVAARVVLFRQDDVHRVARGNVFGAFEAERGQIDT